MRPPMGGSSFAVIAPRLARAHASERDARRLRRTREMMRNSVRLTVKVRAICPKGQVFLMADIFHPEIDPLTTIPEAEAHVLLCHPDDEQRIRHALAVLEERPQWWRTYARLQQMVGFVVGGEYDVEVAGEAEGIEAALARWVRENP